MNIKYNLKEHICDTRCPYEKINGDVIMVASIACQKCKYFKKSIDFKKGIVKCLHPKEKKKNYVWVAESSVNGGEWKALTGDSAGSKKECLIMISEMRNGCGYSNVKLRPVKYETTNN